MVALPLSILALAAGVYLLMQLKHYGFTGIYKILAWLVVLLSLAFMVAGGIRGIMHHRHKNHCSQMGGHCDMKDSGACPYMKDGHCDMKGGDPGHCAMSGNASGNMSCCAKDTNAKKCDMSKPSCCMKGGEAKADSSGHK
jgi:hypothetical protein